MPHLDYTERVLNTWAHHEMIPVTDTYHNFDQARLVLETVLAIHSWPVATAEAVQDIIEAIGRAQMGRTVSIREDRGGDNSELTA